MTKPPSAVIVCVTWDDAHTLEREEIDPDEVSTELHSALRTISYGYLIRSDGSGVSYCADIQIQAGGICYRGAAFIPRCMIVREQTMPWRAARAVRKKVAKIDVPRLEDHSEKPGKALKAPAAMTPVS